MKGNLLLGTASRKIGDVVMYYRNGVQCARKRVTPKNPRSAKQNLQRMSLATLSKMASALKIIVDHSFEGIPVGGRSINHFVKINTPMARAKAFASGSYLDNFPAGFIIKNAAGVACLPARISSGHLSPLTYECFNGLGDVGKCTMHLMGIGKPAGLILDKVISSAADYIETLSWLGVAPGEQLTLVAIMAQLDSNGAPEFSYDYEATGAKNVFTWPEFARIVFKKAEEVDYSTPFNFGVEIDNTNVINPLVIDVERSSRWVRGVEVQNPLSGGNNRMEFSLLLESSLAIGVGGALVHSSFDGNGRWNYSSQTLAWSDDFLTWFQLSAADLVAPSYGDSAASADSTLYLRQADNGTASASNIEQESLTPAAGLGYTVDGNLIRFANAHDDGFGIDFNVVGLSVAQAESLAVKVNDDDADGLDIQSDALLTTGKITITVDNALGQGVLSTFKVYLGTRLLWSGLVYAG